MKRNFLQTQSGQGLVEYLLILVVVITIALAIFGRFFQPFGKFVSNYMGEYTKCLLETGELPGSTGENRICEEAYEPFTLAEGRPPRPYNSSNNGESTSNPRGPTNSSSANASSSNERGSGSGKSRSSRAQGSGGGGYNQISHRSPRRASEGNENPKAKVLEAKGGEEQRYRRGFGSNSTTIIRIRRINSKGLAGLVAQEAKKRKREVSVRRAANINETEVGGSNQKKLLLKKSNTDKKLTEKEEEPFTIGKWIRLLMIILILIAILVFLFLQAGSIAKGWDRGD